MPARGVIFFIFFSIRLSALHARAASRRVAERRNGRFVCITAAWNSGFTRCQVPRKYRHVAARRVLRDQRPARIARDSRWTVSISTATLSGGVAGTMPWPRLKTWPGRGPAARTTAAASRDDRRCVREQHQRVEIALQRDAFADAARAPPQGRRSSRDRRTARRTPRCASSHCPPPFVNTIAGTLRPSAAGRERRQHRSHRTRARTRGRPRS